MKLHEIKIYSEEQLVNAIVSEVLSTSISFSIFCELLSSGFLF